MKENNIMNYYQICIDGIDKTGKDTIVKEIDLLSNHKYIIYARGLMSNIAYCNIYGGRDYQYNVNNYKNTLIVYLTVEKEDFVARHKACKELDITTEDYDFHISEFEKVKNNLSEQGLNILSFNTSYCTPYMIAKSIIKYMEEINKE